MQRRKRWNSRFALFVLAAVLLPTLAALGVLFEFPSGKLRLQVDPSLDALIAPDTPSRQFYDTIRRRYGNDESVLVVLSAPSIYDAGVIRRIGELSGKLSELPGVVKVLSLTTVPMATVGADEVSFETVQLDRLDAQGIERLRAQVQASPLLAGNLVSADGRAAAIDVRLEALSDREMLEQRVAENIRDTAYVVAGEGIEIAVAGAPVIREATSRSVVNQLQWMIPAIVGLLSLMLLITFRNLRGVLLPLASIAIALTWTLAAATLFGLQLNLITSLVPPLLITMGLAYCAHVLCEYEVMALRHEDPDRRVGHLMKEINGPVLLTAGTTAVSLLALAINDLPAIRQFAFLSALGVVIGAFISLSFLPAALRLTARRRPREPREDGPFERVSRWLGRFDIANRRAILGTAGLVFIAASYIGSQVQTGDHFVGVFPPDAPVRMDYDKVNRAIGGVNPLLIVLDSGSAGTFEDPSTLAAVEQLQEWLRKQPEVGAVTSVVDHVRTLSATIGLHKAEIPDDKAMVQQLLFFGDNESLASLLNGDRSETMLSLRLVSDDTADIAALVERLQGQFDNLPRGIKASVTGNAALLTESVHTVTGGQIISIGLALLLVWVCLSAQFGSLSIGFLASLPTFLQTALYFGALSLCGIKLNATTSLVECLVLGLAVDDTIHYLARFNNAAKRKGSEEQAAVLALMAVLRPITMTKAMLALGFLTLVTGELQNQVLFGWLAAFTLAAAWLVDVLVTPAFMSGMRVVTLWDSLRLNLGRHVQATIPMFAGLSTRQARIFALMSHLEKHRAGTQIMHKGELGGDIYVVIEGKLSVWVEGEDGERNELGVLGRGAVVGETGYFGQRRVANVSAATEVRVLRFDDADQERICKLYPSIAARVFFNLNKLQAERRAAQGLRPYGEALEPVFRGGR